VTEGGSLREQQAEFTKQLLLEAARQVLLENDPDDFSMPKVAKAAGVSYRTMYRYFPSRQALLNEFSAWISEQHVNSQIEDDDEFESIGDYIRRLFGIFDANAQDFQAAARLSSGYLRAADHEARTVQFRAWFDEQFPDLDPYAGDAAFAVLRFLIGHHAWYAVRQRYGFEDGKTGDAIAWAVDELFRSLQEGRVPVRTEREERVLTESSADDD
jgi:AcrR family transcriptional regulator